MDQKSYLRSLDPAYLEQLYEKYLEAPHELDETWQYFFQGIEIANESSQKSPASSSPEKTTSGYTFPEELTLDAKVTQMVNSYRSRGILLSDLNPLENAPSSHPALDLQKFGLSKDDLSKKTKASGLIGLPTTTVQETWERLKKIYCKTIGIEVSHILDAEIREWIIDSLEETSVEKEISHEERKWIHQRLARAEQFESFLHTRYVAQKRFSIEGADALIPSLDCMMETFAELGGEQLVIGMAHRGRLNVLHNVFGKPAASIFTEFEGNYKFDSSLGEGDVKYHLGFSRDYETKNGKKLHLSLGFNPSHLEFINPVIEGMVRAKQSIAHDTSRTKVAPILIHGDAAFAGQGICYETLNLSQLQGFATGGTIHIILNNQVGFTTDPSDARSTPYSTDLAKMLEAPVFHVNGDDPEAVWFVSKLATKFRQKFKKDVFIDLICYRRYGHNEGDEPLFTQPLMYKKIKTHPTPREVYEKKLLSQGILQESEAKKVVQDMVAGYMEDQKTAKEKAPYSPPSAFEGLWKDFIFPKEEDLFRTIETKVSKTKLIELSEKLNSAPDGFHVNPKLKRLLDQRLEAVQKGEGIDWGNAELLAYGSLVTEGTMVRLTGQDVERGTFTHRHCVMNDVENGKKYSALQNVSSNQAPFEVYNSLLSESAVLGFEFGFSIAQPKSLILWEAQFGDFANGAQVIIDQFIASSESKWRRMSGLTLLLPHGYEGQGPEHSSARIERFLQLCGKNNIFVCNFTTPAQIFHALRRQALWNFRKPMIVMTPKSLLRHPQAISTLDDLSQGSFQEVISDQDAEKKSDVVNKVVLVSGKLYYDLLQEKQEKKVSSVALVRVEQLYPWPEKRIQEELRKYKNAKKIIWAQEEPKNMGAWRFVHSLYNETKNSIEYCGRDMGSSPAVGSIKVHQMEQRKIIEEVIHGN